MGILYALSRGSSINKDSDRLEIRKDGNLVGRVPIQSITAIVIGPMANMSTAAMFACLEINVPIIFFDKKWHFVGQLLNEKTSISVIKQQFSAFENPDKVLSLVKKLVDKKTGNQYSLLKGYTRTVKKKAFIKVLQVLKAQRKKINMAQTVDSLRGIEGSCAKAYFTGMGILLDSKTWHFKGRTRPATDPVNALLNFGYAFLEREVRIAVVASGMDTRVGFFHSNNGRKDSLVFDLMELFRQPIIDRFVLNLLRLKVYKIHDFIMDDERGCILTDEGRMMWYRKYEHYMEKTYREYGGLSPRQLIQTQVEKFSRNFEC